MKLVNAAFIPASPTLQFIDCAFSFKTKSPAAQCTARMMLLPVKTDDGPLEWKIWILSTSLSDLDIHPENESLLTASGRNLSTLPSDLETEVLIIGGGNA